MESSPGLIAGRSPLRESKPDSYFAQDRSEFLDWVGGPCRSVLEIGCGTGGSAAWYRDHGAQTVVGVELDPTTGEMARKQFDIVYVEPVESALGKIEGAFDLIVCADVLEHLHDPWTIVRRLAGQAHAETRLAVSIPNIRYAGAIARIVAGRGFEYDASGIFDATHLRFFTPRNVEQLLLQGGWMPRRWGSSSYGRLGGLTYPLRRRVRGSLRRALDGFLAGQLYVVAVPEAVNGSRLGGDRDTS